MAEHDPGDRGGSGDWVFTFFGLILAVTPLALWIAWSPTVLVIVLLVALVGLMVCGGLSMFAPRRGGEGERRQGITITPYMPPADRGMTELFRPYNPQARIAYLKLVWQHRRLAGELFFCVLVLGCLMLYLAWTLVDARLLTWSS